MKLLLLSASAILAAVPGLYVIKSGIGTPPEQNILFGGVIEAFGALSLIILWIYRKEIRRLPKKRIVKWSIISGVFFFIFLCSYIALFNFCVVRATENETAYFPLWVSGQLSEMVEAAGSRRAAITKYGIDAIYDEIDKMPDISLGLSTAILLFVYQSVFTSLVISFGLLGIYEESSFLVRPRREAGEASPEQ